MNTFYEHHKDSIRFGYRCFDRVLLNGLIQPFQQPERVIGFFNSYRHLYPVSRGVLRGAAEQFQTWVKGAGRQLTPRLSRHQRARATNLSTRISKAPRRIRLSSSSKPESRRGS